MALFKSFLIDQGPNSTQKADQILAKWWAEVFSLLIDSYASLFFFLFPPWYLECRMIGSEVQLLLNRPQCLNSTPPKCRKAGKMCPWVPPRWLMKSLWSEITPGLLGLTVTWSGDSDLHPIHSLKKIINKKVVFLAWSIGDYFPNNLR